MCVSSYEGRVIQAQRLKPAFDVASIGQLFEATALFARGSQKSGECVVCAKLRGGT